MSELKVYHCNEWHNEYTEFYIKSEADKVIAHQKYKRCLAMASRCFSKSNYHFALFRHGEDVKENDRKSSLYLKWRWRWLAIADKFKPNSTAQ